VRHLATLLIASTLAVLLSACGGATTTRDAGASLPAVNTAAARQLLSPDENLQTLAFPPIGSTTMSGRIEGYSSTAYAVPVAAGQTLTVSMSSPSDNAYFNIHDAADGSGAAVFRGEVSGRTARLTAPAEVTYLIRPFQPRATARRNETADYSITVQRQ
jgi:hypothetical protein